MNRIRLMFVVFASVVVSLVGTAAVAEAAPAQVDPVQQLVAAGVPEAVARQAADAHPAAAGDVVTISHPGYQYRFPGTQVDAVLDREHGTVRVLQRWLGNGIASQLSVGWVNLATGRSGITGLPESVPIADPMYANYSDRAATLGTGSGPVAIVVWGRIPAWTGLIPAAPEYFGILTPAGSLLQV